MITISKKGTSTTAIRCPRCKQRIKEFAVILKDSKTMRRCWPCTALAFQKQNTSFNTLLRAAELEIRTKDSLGDCTELLDTMRQILDINT